MTEVFLERSFDEPLTERLVQEMARDSVGCFSIYRVDWLGSLLATDGRRMVCRFAGPDADSARSALRQAGADVRVLWPGTVHEAPTASDPPLPATHVLVTRRFEAPVTMESIQALEDAGAWCLETHNVRFLRSFFATDQKRMLCLYRAPDAESVRRAQHQAGMPVESVWACLNLEPPGA